MSEIEASSDRVSSPPIQKKVPVRRFWSLSAILLTLIIAGAAGFVFTLNQPPKDFITPTSITIEPGTGVRTITAQLEDASIVSSAAFLYLILNIYFEPEAIKASTYIFEKPMTSFEVARQLVAGDFDSDLISFTHYEGERATHIAANAEQTLKNFDTAKFLERAIPLEGKLYPETYRIPETFTADELVDLMYQTFLTETEPIQEQIQAHPLTYNEILTLASILEREANTPESMKIISGILLGRMEAGMPLQADASIEYILDKPLKELTGEDLKVDSPYNTYTNRGLPPTPIGNPGIDAINAVLEPTRTDYVYYITDSEGTFHYAVTYDEHLDNVNKYLR